jgi:hypothetical protein
LRQRLTQRWTDLHLRLYVHLIAVRIKDANALFVHAHDFTERDDQRLRRTLADTTIRRFNVKDFSVGTGWCG